MSSIRRTALTPDPQVEDATLSRLQADIRSRQPELNDRLSALVQIESPSSSKSGVDHAQTLFAGWATAAGGKVQRHRRAAYGDSIAITFGSAPRANRQPGILLLGHMDTVHEIGSLAQMPFKVTRDRISGPGVLDMKAGLLMALTALESVQQMQRWDRRVTLLIHGDEEIGSPASRALTEKLAVQSSAVYVLEPAQGAQGAYKTARKGVGRYRLTVQGRAAHSGVDFEAGHSAIVELARHIATLHSFTDLASGITVNPGVIAGGTTSNVIAAEAWVEIDVRVRRRRDAATIDRRLRGLKPVDKGCTLILAGGINRPPMERSRGTVLLFQRAQRLGAGLGIDLQEAATGGASDGNFTAALGVPTLDGMGAVGAGAHTPDEHLLRRHLAERTALLAAMLL